MTYIPPATPGMPKQLSASQHNAMAYAVNSVIEKRQQATPPRINTAAPVFVPVYATQFLRAGCLAKLNGPVLDINEDFPHASTAYKSWMTTGMTESTVKFAANPAGYAGLPDSWNPSAGSSEQGDSGRGVYGIPDRTIVKGGVGRIHVTGVAAARVFIRSATHDFCWPATSTQGGLPGTLVSGFGGRPGYQLFGKPANIAGQGGKYTWCYILLNLTTSPYATRISGKVRFNFTSSSATFQIKNPVGLNGVLFEEWREGDFTGVTVTNTLNMEGVQDFHAYADYNWYDDRWECTAIECGD